jgi:hypothetical protein
VDEWREPARTTQEWTEDGIRVGVNLLLFHAVYWAETQQQGCTVRLECRVDKDQAQEDMPERLARGVRCVLRS